MKRDTVMETLSASDAAGDVLVCCIIESCTSVSLVSQARKEA